MCWVIIMLMVLHQCLSRNTVNVTIISLNQLATQLVTAVGESETWFWFNICQTPKYNILIMLKNALENQDVNHLKNFEALVAMSLT
jgi:hypothetical protein